MKIPFLRKWTAPGAAIRLVVLPLLITAAVRADTIEMKSGERVDGAFKHASAAGAVIEVAGQAITIPLEKVKAIYFGAAERPAPPAGEFDGALDALKALQSATETGISFRDYTQLVLDARIKVDRSLRSASNTDDFRRKAVQIAIGEYELARDVWDVSLNFLNAMKFNADRLEAIARMIEDSEAKCSVLTEFVVREPNKHGQQLASSFLSETSALYEVRHVRTHELLWSCASARVAEVERLGATKQ